MRANDIARIVGKIVSTMINHCLECPNHSEKGRLAIIEASHCKTGGEAYAIDWDGLQWMIVECTVGKRHVYIMVHRVNMFCSTMLVKTVTNGALGVQLTVKPLVHMESPMGEVLKCVRQYHGADVLEQRHKHPVNTFCHHHFQSRGWYGFSRKLSLTVLGEVAHLALGEC